MKSKTPFEKLIHLLNTHKDSKEIIKRKEKQILERWEHWRVVDEIKDRINNPEQTLLN